MIGLFLCFAPSWLRVVFSSWSTLPSQEKFGACSSDYLLIRPPVWPGGTAMCERSKDCNKNFWAYLGFRPYHRSSFCLNTTRDLVSIHSCAVGGRSPFIHTSHNYLGSPPPPFSCLQRSWSGQKTDLSGSVCWYASQWIATSGFKNPRQPIIVSHISPTRPCQSICLGLLPLHFLLFFG